MTTDPSERQRAQELQETIQGIAEVLQREQPNRTISELWDEALSIYRVQYERVVLPPPDVDTGAK